MTNEKVLTGETMAVSAAIKLEDQETALMEAEEKLMEEEDEEVTSVESGNVEDAMVNIALVQSVVESGDPNLKERLRKRPRPSGQDLERLERFQSTGEGGLARAKVEARDPSAVPNPLSHHIPEPTPIVERSMPYSLPPGGVPCYIPAPSPAATQDVYGVLSESRRRVNFEDPPVSRPRGFSIDLDLNLDFPDPDDTPSHIPDISVSGRSRAFSFECFAFGINADEPLPPLDSSDPSTTRPRGDSIIFDPSSFHEGGIHEQKALEEAETKPVKKIRRPVASPVPSDAPPNPLFSSMVNSSGSTTLPVELLNKDGRVGIYLPEARRARIARFHAKRSRRVWRKRIKYDCRKKLADSRPRIKGRFVKRSDVDDV